MGRKVFISVLGAGNYGECKYTKENFTSEPVCYIQEATLKMMHAEQEWDSSDAAYILLTDGAEEKHWEQLSSRFAQMELPFQVKSVKIPMCNNEAEIWDIFTRTFEHIKEEDTLYIDITHGFRYLPMLVVALINYSKFLKNTRVASITYGNFEARNRDTNEAQIVELTSLSTLLDWNYAAGEFINNGNISPMVELSDSVITPIMKNAQTRSKEVGALKGFLGSLSAFIDELRTCRGKEIIKATKIRSAYSNKDTMARELIAPLTPLFARIIDSLSMFDVNGTPANTLKAARWCYERGMYQQAITMLQESIVTFICDECSFDYEKRDRRGLTSSAINIKIKKSENNPEQWKADEEDKETIRKILTSRIISDSRFADIYANLSEIRNDINHSGMREKNFAIKKIREDIKSALEYIEKLCQCPLMESTAPHIAGERERIIINLSNHPSAGWSAEQTSAAGEYGRIVDIPFPAIDENADTSSICNLADEYMQKIESYGSSNDVTVHIMGEQTFLYSMLHRLHSAGYCCIASTTRRYSEELPDGSRKVTFTFAQFREYEAI